MIEIISGFPDNVIGFTAKGKVTAKEYESVVIPLVEEKLKKHPKISVFYHLGNEFSGVEAEAVREDWKLGRRHLAAWEKGAVVTDINWIRGAVRLFGLMMPGEVKVFSNDQLDEARAWITK